MPVDGKIRAEVSFVAIVSRIEELLT